MTLQKLQTKDIEIVPLNNFNYLTPLIVKFDLKYNIMDF